MEVLIVDDRVQNRELLWASAGPGVEIAAAISGRRWAVAALPIGELIVKPDRERRAAVIGVAPVLEERLPASLIRTDQGAVFALNP